jgi:hypothetical protein
MRGCIGNDTSNVATSTNDTDTINFFAPQEMVGEISVVAGVSRVFVFTFYRRSRERAANQAQAERGYFRRFAAAREIRRLFCYRSRLSQTAAECFAYSRNGATVEGHSAESYDVSS